MFTIAAVKNYHRLKGCKQPKLFSYNLRGQKSKLGFIGPKAQRWQGCALYGVFRGRSVSWSFLASYGHRYSLACGPFFYFQSQHHSIVSLTKFLFCDVAFFSTMFEYSLVSLSEGHLQLHLGANHIPYFLNYICKVTPTNDVD